jgi:predicted nuclease of predicted toxin-antitoxin system
MRFLVDAQLPPSLARWLGQRQCSATAGRDLGLRDSDDGNPGAPAVVWLRIGNCTNRVLFTWLEPLLPEIMNRLAQGEKLIELRAHPP